MVGQDFARRHFLLVPWAEYAATSFTFNRYSYSESGYRNELPESMVYQHNRLLERALRFFTSQNMPDAIRAIVLRTSLFSGHCS